MTKLTLWAPKAKSVSLYSNDLCTPMIPGEDGWWSCHTELKQGSDYGFLLDGKGPYADPRSRWQPNGPHGLSRLFIDDYAWHDQQWQGIPLAETVIYELHVGTFTEAGTFLAIIGRLPHLRDLGITHLELLPIAEFDGAHGWGYDGVNLFAPHHRYGSPADLMALVDACHEQGLGILLDVVYNHLGPSGNYLSLFAPYFHKHYHTPWGEAVNMDGYDSPEVRRYFIDNALMWLNQFHFDGLRLDAVQTIADGSAIHFLEQLATEVDALQERLKRPLLLIAESHMNDSRLMLDRKNGGYGLQAQWHDDFHHAVYSYFTGESAGYFQDYGKLEDLAKVLNQGVFFDGNYCHYRRRLLGRPATGLSGLNFVAYIQNHDQVGNRPGGERLSHVINLGQMKIAAALLLTSPFIPMLFQGEEWGSSSPFYYFTDHQSPGLGKAINHGRRTEAQEFGWPLTHFIDPQRSHSFTQSCLDWEELAKPQQAQLLNWYQQLLHLRRRHPELRGGGFLIDQTHADSVNKTLTIQRGNFILICNFADKQRTITLSPLHYQEVLSSSTQFILTHRQLQAPEYSAILLREVDQGQ